MLLETTLLAYLLTAAPASPPPAVPAGRYVLVNGFLAPGEWDDALAVPLDAETELRIKQDDRSVFLALVFKGPRHTGLDLYWSAGGPPEMFHVSSALGERHGKGGTWSEMEWGTNRLWTANPIGLISGDGGQQILQPEAFELQIDKARLGGLDLRLFVHLKRPEKTLPAGATPEKPESWLAVPLRIPGSTTPLK
jgi:hypothetical protein